MICGSRSGRANCPTLLERATGFTHFVMPDVYEIGACKPLSRFAGEGLACIMPIESEPASADGELEGRPR